MATELALILVALLLGLWALTSARRAANAAQRTAIAAEKSALAAERSAMAARRAAEAAEFSALAARESSGGGPAVDEATQAKAARLDAVVMDLINSFPKEASAWPLIGRHPELVDAEVDEIIHKAFHLMGRTEFEAKQHSVAVLNLRRDQTIA